MRQSNNLLLCGSIILGLSAIPSPTYATAFIFTFFSGASYKVAAGAIVGGTELATVSVNKGSNAGTVGGVVVASGGVLLGIVDPPGGGIFHNGSFMITYPSQFLGIYASGWLGQWGADASLPTLPVDSNQWGDGFQVALQDPNSALSATTNNAVAGEQQVSFDWGTNGLSVANSDPFNFFATAFTARQELRVDFLGDSADAPPAGANFYVSTPGFACSLAGQSSATTCGEETTQYFKLSPVPEPATWVLMLTGLATVGSAAWWRDLRRHFISPIWFKL
jgi:PEP-CTERM motif